MRKGLIVLSMLLCSITSASAQVSIGIGLPGVSIGINLPVYPTLVRVPGYPVYYAPQVRSNYFFYDGMYWVYEQDNWYASSWYNGPWALVIPEAVPLFLLRVPVRYYRRPPAYFHGWRSEAPPRWGEHWGNTWERSHHGWDNWNRSAVPAPAPLPTYQRQYSGNRYPRAEQQPVLQGRNYRYQPQEAVVQQHYQAQRVESQPASSPQGGQGVPHSPQRGAAPAPPRQQPRQTGGGDLPRPAAAPAPSQQGVAAAPRAQPQQKGGGDVPRPAAAPAPSQQRIAPAPRGQPPQTAGANVQRSVAPSPSQQGAAPALRIQPQQRGGADVQRPAAATAPAPQGRPTAQPQGQQPQQRAAERQQQAPTAQGQVKGPPGRGAAKEPKQDQEQRGGTGQQRGGERN